MPLSVFVCVSRQVQIVFVLVRTAVPPPACKNKYLYSARSQSTAKSNSANHPASLSSSSLHHHHHQPTKWRPGASGWRSFCCLLCSADSSACQPPSTWATAPAQPTTTTSTAPPRTTDAACSGTRGPRTPLVPDTSARPSRVTSSRSTSSRVGLTTKKVKFMH